MTCAACGVVNEAGKRFCMECGDRRGRLGEPPVGDDRHVAFVENRLGRHSLEEANRLMSSARDAIASLR
jgi:hypothetical protein